MTLAEKLKHLRQVEGELRGLGRPMIKAEVLRAMHAGQGEAVSHAYLCQLESGARTHMSPGTRALLARFFNVLPGYLVSDPDGYQAAIVSDMASEPDTLRNWLAARAEDLRDDVFLYHVLLKMAHHPDPRQLLATLDELMDAETVSKRSA